MSSDLYATAAQVLPVVLLALIWESRFLERLRGQNRRLRRDDPGGVLFWTRPRVRAYSLFIVTVIVTGTALAVLALATLLTRVVLEVLAATSAEPGSGEAAPPAPRSPSPAPTAPSAPTEP